MRMWSALRPTVAAGAWPSARLPAGPLALPVRDMACELLELPGGRGWQARLPDERDRLARQAVGRVAGDAVGAVAFQRRAQLRHVGIAAGREQRAEAAALRPLHDRVRRE